MEIDGETINFNDLGFTIDGSGSNLRLVHNQTGEEYVFNSDGEIDSLSANEIAFGANDEWAVLYDNAQSGWIIRDQTGASDEDVALFKDGGLIELNQNIDVGENDISNVDELETAFTTHKTSISNNYTVESDEGAVVAGPLTGSGSISGDGKLSVLREGEHAADREIRAPDVIVYEADNDYVAIGDDGVIQSGTDGETVLQAGVDAAPSGGFVQFSGTYTVNNILIEKDLRFEGGSDAVLEAETSTDTVVEVFDERNLIDFTDITATFGDGDDTVSVSDATFMSVGQHAVIYSDEPIDEAGEVNYGEPHIIAAIDGNDITFQDTIIRDEYDVGAEDVNIATYDNVDVAFREFTIRGTGREDENTGIKIYNGGGATVENVTVRDCGYSGIRARYSHNIKINNCTVIDSSRPSDGYGIKIEEGSADAIVSNCVVKRCRHPYSVTPAGTVDIPSRGVVFDGCIGASDKSSCFNQHGAGSWDILISDCIAHSHGEQKAINLGGIHGRISDTMCYGTIGDRDPTNVRSLSVSNVEIQPNGENAMEFFSDYETLTLENVTIRGAHTTALRAGGNIDSIDLNRIVQESTPTDEALRFDSTTAFTVGGGFIRNCLLNADGTYGIRIEGGALDGVDICGNQIELSNNDGHITLSDIDGELTNCSIYDNTWQAGSGSVGRPFYDQAGGVHNNNLFKNNRHNGLDDDTYESDASSIERNNDIF